MVGRGANNERWKAVKGFRGWRNIEDSASGWGVVIEGAAKYGPESQSEKYEVPRRSRGPPRRHTQAKRARVPTRQNTEGQVLCSFVCWPVAKAHFVSQNHNTLFSVGIVQRWWVVRQKARHESSDSRGA